MSFKRFAAIVLHQIRRTYKNKMPSTSQVFLHSAIWSHFLSIPKVYRSAKSSGSHLCAHMCFTAIWQLLKCFTLVLTLRPYPTVPEHFVNWGPILKQSTRAVDFSIFGRFVHRFKATFLFSSKNFFLSSSSPPQWRPITRLALSFWRHSSRFSLVCEESD